MEIVISIVVSLVAVAAMVGSRKFPGTGLSTDIGSARFPILYACALLVLSVILVVQNLRKRKQHPLADTGIFDKDANAEAPNYWRTLTGMGATAMYLGTLPYLGYALTTGIYLSFLMALLGMRHTLWNPLLAVAITVTMYFTFSTGLHVPLPMGSLFE